MNLSFADLEYLYQLPFNDLISQAHLIHKQHHSVNTVHLCGSISIKTGNCPEDCAYCPQSVHYKTYVAKELLLNPSEVLKIALNAKNLGVTHFCLGAAWSFLPKGSIFQKLLEIIKQVHDTGLQVCCSLGSISAEQTKALLDAGCSMYNYNLDTSPDFYPKIITTRTFASRYETLQMIRKSNLKISCGGILGMGESILDRLKLIFFISQLLPQPEMVPLNALVAIEGTPLEKKAFIDSFEYVRIVAIARIAMPQSIIAMAAGRYKMSFETQTLAFFSGANAIYIGERILTTPTPDLNSDLNMLKKLKMKCI
ncbi:biotin synthase BioB [Rickettsiella endosymbiont of Rhagonycha lignosa]|uniref:biotin synthase BioB n=1 Tax=Rickettsiella endosymbiont of Rhagonycha lignosa TaxID=3077937 RepID=UPI00313C0B5E